MRHAAAVVLAFGMMASTASAAVWTVSVIDADMDFLIDGQWDGFYLSVSVNGRPVMTRHYGQGDSEFPISVQYGDTIYVELESVWDNYDLEILDDSGAVRASSYRFPTLSGPEDIVSVRSTMAWTLVVEVEELSDLGYSLRVEVNSNLFRDIGLAEREYAIFVVPGDVIQAEIESGLGRYRLVLYDETGRLVVASSWTGPGQPGTLLAVVAGGRDSFSCAPGGTGREGPPAAALVPLAAILAALAALRTRARSSS